MIRPIVHAITTRTAAEWPADHPLRRVSRVLTESDAKRADFLVCSELGSERLPPTPGDYDIATACTRCAAAIVHRASAPKGPRPICPTCWQALGGAQ